MTERFASESGPRERHLSISRIARYYLLGEAHDEVESLWICLHGYGQLASRFALRFRPIETERRLIVVPEGLSRFYLEGVDGRVGASWMTSEDRQREIDDYVAYLDALYDHLSACLGRRVPLHVLGFSQGAATACRWAVRGVARADRVICWSGLVPPEIELKEEGHRLGSLTLVYGTRDRYLPTDSMQREKGRLTCAGINFEEHTFDGGHRIDDETLRTVGESG